jgi:GMP synthase (glutamine-hydrolysing)
MQEKIIILDFGSQYTQLIARRVREQHVYCEIIPYSKKTTLDDSVKGVIFSGSPFSVMQEDAPNIDVTSFFQQKPVLAICYGAQLIAKNCGGKVEKSATREYGRAQLIKVIAQDTLLNNVSDNTQIWMSHGDTITAIPENFELVAKPAVGVPELPTVPANIERTPALVTFRIT